MDWRHRAACRDEDPELFFPIGNTSHPSPDGSRRRRSAGVAGSRTVYCLGAGDWPGFSVLGGLSEDERRALKRRGARLRPQTV